MRDILKAFETQVMSEAHRQQIGSDWILRAEDAQRLPAWLDWRVWLFMGGRGAGKTRAGAEWVRAEVAAGRARRVALVGPTLGDVREVMIEGPSGVKAVSLEPERPIYEVSRRRLVWPCGAEGFAFSAEDAESLRGPQFDAAWCDEIGVWAKGEAVWDTLMLGLRLGQKPRVAATTTPRATALVKRLVEEAGREMSGVVMTRAPTRANASNLAPGFVEAMEAAYAGSLRARQELEGELMDDPEGAMWTREMVERARVGGVHTIGGGVRGQTPSSPPPKWGGIAAGMLMDAGSTSEVEAPPHLGGGGVGAPPRVRFDRVVVAVDPPVSVGPDADACGIVAAGKMGNVAYVLADGSVRGLKPLEWAGRAVALARTWGAGVIVAESNQGGEMVRQMIEMAGGTLASGVRVKLRHATTSKRDRAEPVSGWYLNDRVKHAGVFRELEDEMCAFGVDRGRSPDRVDAMVWAVSELLQAPPPRPGIRRL